MGRLVNLALCSLLGAGLAGPGPGPALAGSGPGSGPPRTPRAAPPRQDLLDRHGHPIAHLPPLDRDAACAPDLVGAIRRATPAPPPGRPHDDEDQRPAQAALATRLDGELQALAQRVIQHGVERLARTNAPIGAPGTGGQRLAIGQKRVAAIREVHDTELVLDLGLPGTSGRLPLPPPIACPGHPVPPLPPAAARFRPGEHLLVRVLGVEPAGRALLSLQPQAALVALDPRTRDVLALVGGYGQRPFDFDRATQGRRQAGSTWKPLVFAAALHSRKVAASDWAEDLPHLYGGWRPRNFSGTYRGPVRLRQALAQSINTVAVHLLSEVGTGPVVSLAQRLGIPPAQLPRDLTLALGTALVSPLQLAGAYAVFADTLHGRYLPPRLLDSDPDLSGPGPATAREAIPAPLSYLMTSLLQSVIQEGSASRAQDLMIPGLCGKTGTTTQGHDAWFVGYHPDLLAVIWVGDDSAESSPGPGPVPDRPNTKSDQRTGAETALPLWMDFMRAAPTQIHQAGPPPAPWPRPPGLIEVRLPEGGTELGLGDPPGPS